MSDKYRKRHTWNLNRIIVGVAVVSIALNAIYFVRLSSCESSLSAVVSV